MCFSATASFSAGIILTVIGIASIKKIQYPAQIMFAAIPLIFAIQQFTEGFVWMSLTHHGYHELNEFSTYAFLIFAQIIWPLWVPFSMLMIEKKASRKKIIQIFIVLGMILSSYTAFAFLSYKVESRILGQHIEYIVDYPHSLQNIIGALYVISTILPPFLSSVKRMWILGIFILLTSVVTAIFYEAYLVSVWCFFAALMSVFVYWIMKQIPSHIPE
ncbi:MAG: hypothetical protein NT150_10165 [Bacteroidetes bacterium]|nr:hypothetical protein [Bacteroidota bacterium]